MSFTYFFPFIVIFLFLKYYILALSCVAQSAEHHPTKKKVASLIPVQTTCLRCNRMQKATDGCLSPPSLNK